MPHRTKRLIGIILIMIFACYYANITLFYHGHVINGTTIVHSHFHGKDHAQTGTHTGSEVTLISTLSAFQSCAAVLFFTGLTVSLLSVGLFRATLERKAISRPVPYCSLRAPPVLS